MEIRHYIITEESIANLRFRIENNFVSITYLNEILIPVDLSFSKVIFQSFRPLFSKIFGLLLGFFIHYKIDSIFSSAFDLEEKKREKLLQLIKENPIAPKIQGKERILFKDIKKIKKTGRYTISIFLKNSVRKISFVNVHEIPEIVKSLTSLIQNK